MPNTAAFRGEVPMLIPDVRELLVSTGKPYVIENVYGARFVMVDPVMLCGLTFGLRMFRHRLFEANFFILQPAHPSHRGLRVGEGGMVSMCGHGDSGRGRVPWDHRHVASWKAASGIDWMTRDEMSQAIPPAYTEFIGRRLLAELQIPQH